jgi:hypothetical protein
LITKRKGFQMDALTATPQELQELTDGEVLDLVYEIVSNENLSVREMVGAIKRLLEESKGEN